MVSIEIPGSRVHILETRSEKIWGNSEERMKKRTQK
jgi:hypothetical protein